MMVEQGSDCRKSWKMTKDGYFWECLIHNYVFKHDSACKFYEAPPLPSVSSGKQKKEKKGRVSYRKKKVPKGSQIGSQSGSILPELTLAEKDILGMLTVDFLTRKQISIRRQTSIRAVNKIIKKLKEKGALTTTLNMVPNFAPTQEPFAKNLPNNMIRLHGEEWHVIILFKDEKYRSLLERSNFFDFDGNTIRLSRDSIEVYVSKSFIADSVNKATLQSIQYFEALLTRLEHHLSIILKKPRVQNIKRVNAHYSEMNNELAKDTEEKGDRIRIYTREDGKLWFLIDNSFNLHEAEAVHPESSKDDMVLVKSAFDDIRAGEWERMKYGIDAIIKTQKEYAEQIALHLEVERKANISQDKTIETLSNIDASIHRFTQVADKLNTTVSKKKTSRPASRLHRVKVLRQKWGW